MAKIISIVPTLEFRKKKPKGYGVMFEHSFNLTAGVKKGDYENRDDENERDAIEKTIRAFEELMDMWRYGELDEAIEEAREFREMDGLDNKE